MSAKTDPQKSGKGTSLTPALFAVLNYLQAREGAIQQQIGSAMGIDPSTMVSLVDQLEGAGLAERRAHPKDRRALRGPDHTKRAANPETCARARAEGRGRRPSGLSPAERRELVTLLRKAFEAAPPQPPWSSEEVD